MAARLLFEAGSVVKDALVKRGGGMGKIAAVCLEGGRELEKR